MSMQGPGRTGDGGDDRSTLFESQHAAIIERTLRWADEAAARRDYVEALRWVETIRSLGEALPEYYEAKRQTWLQSASASPGPTLTNRRSPGVGSR
jgi:hypothetical protein